MAERMKENLEATDEEWTLLQPLLEKVQTLQMQARGGQGMMGGRRGGPEAGPPPGDARSNNAVAKIQQELRALLENKDADPAQIKTKLEALRSAREKQKAELTTAQQALREVLSQRQEAQLVMMGILE
ncbi:MAG: hypothetical protein HC898_08810 [Phycisphaerales bacterium]|nr:hypothetical protein [Phycisphaerales bacterium]